MQMTEASRDGIVKAFGCSERFPAGSQGFELLSPFIGRALAAVGDRSLNSKVTLAGLADVVSRFLGYFIDDEAFRSALAEAVRPATAIGYSRFARQLALIAADPQKFLDDHNLTEAEAMVRYEAGLNKAAKELYLREGLTFGALLNTSPETFIPL